MEHGIGIAMPLTAFRNSISVRSYYCLKFAYNGPRTSLSFLLPTLFSPLILSDLHLSDSN